MSVAPADKDASGISKAIRSVNIVQWVIAILCMIIAGISGDLILRKLWLPVKSQSAALQARGYDSLLTTYIWMLIIAFVLIWLGVGLRQLRRYVRPIGMSIFGLFTLKMLTGSVLLVLMSNVFLHSLSRAQFSTEAVWATLGTVFIAFSVVFCIIILLGVALFFFYRSHALKIALEKPDMAKYWTDAVPMPLMLGCVLFAYSALCDLTNLLDLDITVYKLILPDPVKACLLVAAMALLAYLAWGFARKQRLAWYVALLSAPLWLATHYYSGFVIPDSMVSKVAELTKQGIDFNGMMDGIIPIINWAVVAQFSVFVIYLLAVRKHFHDGPVQTNLTAQTGSPELLKIYAAPAMIKGGGKEVVWMAVMAGMGAMTQSYLLLSTLLMGVVLLAYYGALRPLMVPAVILRERGFSLPLMTSPFTAHYAYADIKTIQLWSVLSKDTRRQPGDAAILNLYTGNMREADIARLKDAFVAKGLQVSETPQTGT